MGTYPVGNQCYQVVPEDVQNQKQGHQKVEDVVDREHLDQLERENRMNCKCRRKPKT